MAVLGDLLGVYTIHAAVHRCDSGGRAAASAESVVR